MGLSIDDLNKIKLNSLIQMADEISELSKEDETKIMGDPSNFRI